MSSSQPTSPPDPSSQTKKLRWSLLILFLVLIFGMIGYGIRGVIPVNEVREVDGYKPWSKEVIEVASAIPVQDGGRVKPLATYARFRMLTFKGELKIKIKSGEKVYKIGPTEWLLDCLFRPELADNLPIFRLDDSYILRPIGIELEDRRVRLSFNDIKEGGDATQDGFDKLLATGRELLDRQDNQGDESLNPNEKKLLDFAQLVLNYTGVRNSMDVMRGGLPPIDASEFAFVSKEILEEMGKVADPSTFGHWMPVLDRVLASLQRMNTAEANAFAAELSRQLAFAKYGPAIFAPEEKDDETWGNLGNLIEAFNKGELKAPIDFYKDFRTLSRLNRLAQDPQSDEFLGALEVFKNDLKGRAVARGEGEKIDTEVSYYERNYFMNALVWFILTFLVTAIGWVVRSGRSGKVVNYLAVFLFLLGTGYVIGGLIHRYVITGRPPVSHLYDTIPFITACSIIVLGLAELMTRRRILLSCAAAIGVIGLFFAFRFELGDAKDNMDPLRAVLDSNYWLATHVVTITIGYCGGLVACFLSMVYVFVALAGVVKDPKSFHTFMTRTVYGLTCFTLFFSIVGTVLGGIWANDSWGRFWGWDPKENGALLIVLWSLIIIHARFAGWLRGWGLHIMSILGGSIVVFSWWGVNMLGVGLHSYGFIEGANTIWYVYGATLIASVVGLVAKKIESRGASLS